MCCRCWRATFCDAGANACRLFARGRPLFDDVNHLSTAGSLALAEHIEPALIAFIRDFPTRGGRHPPNS